MQNAGSLLTERHGRGMVLVASHRLSKHTEKWDGCSGLICNGQQVIMICSTERLNCIDS